MSHFYGTLQGSRGEATRCGTKKSGLTTYSASWQGAVRVTLWEQDGVDMADVSLSPWAGSGTFRTLYRGPINGEERNDGM